MCGIFSSNTEGYVFLFSPFPRFWFAKAHAIENPSLPRWCFHRQAKRQRMEEARQQARSIGRAVVFAELMNHMGVSKNRGTPKWMIYNGNPY